MALLGNDVTELTDLMDPTVFRNNETASNNSNEAPSSNFQALPPSDYSTKKPISQEALKAIKILKSLPEDELQVALEMLNNQNSTDLTEYGDNQTSSSNSDDDNNSSNSMSDQSPSLNSMPDESPALDSISDQSPALNSMSDQSFSLNSMSDESSSLNLNNLQSKGLSLLAKNMYLPAENFLTPGSETGLEMSSEDTQTLTQPDDSTKKPSPQNPIQETLISTRHSKREKPTKKKSLTKEPPTTIEKWRLSNMGMSKETYELLIEINPHPHIAFKQHRLISKEPYAEGVFSINGQYNHKGYDIMESVSKEDITEILKIDVEEGKIRKPQRSNVTGSFHYALCQLYGCAGVEINKDKGFFNLLDVTRVAASPVIKLTTGCIFKGNFKKNQVITDSRKKRTKINELVYHLFFYAAQFDCAAGYDAIADCLEEEYFIPNQLMPENLKNKAPNYLEDLIKRLRAKAKKILEKSQKQSQPMTTESQSSAMATENQSSEMTTENQSQTRAMETSHNSMSFASDGPSPRATSTSTATFLPSFTSQQNEEAVAHSNFTSPEPVPDLEPESISNSKKRKRSQFENDNIESTETNGMDTTQGSRNSDKSTEVNLEESNPNKKLKVGTQ